MISAELVRWKKELSTISITDRSPAAGVRPALGASRESVEEQIKWPQFRAVLYIYFHQSSDHKRDNFVPQSRSNRIISKAEVKTAKTVRMVFHRNHRSSKPSLAWHIDESFNASIAQALDPWHRDLGEGEHEPRNQEAE
jgi:hypothetical protein